MSLVSLKKRILKLLEEDEEFRLVVAAKVGLLKILEKLEQHDRKFNEILERLERHEEEVKKIWSEIRRIWEEIHKIWIKLEEHDRKFNEILERLDRHEKILLRHEEEIHRIWKEIHKVWEKLEQHDRKFNEILERLDRHEQILLRHERILEKHTRALGSLGEDVGLLVEAFLSQRVEDSIRERIRDEGDKLLTVRYRFMVNRDYEVDMYVETEKKIYVIEIKSRPSVRDVDKLVRIRRYLSRKEVKEVIALLVTFKAKVQKRIIDKASRYNIELILY